MPAAPIPHNEAERLAELRRYAVLDTPAEQNFDDLTELAAQICQVPVCLVSLVDSDRQWFKSCFGLGANQTPRDQAFCGYTILGTEPFIVEDASSDPRVCDNPLVLNEPHIRFYAGIPLISAQGYGLGSFCVIDFVPRQLTPLQLDTLQRLARQVIALLESRLLNQRIGDYADALEQAHQKAMVASEAKSRFLATMSHEIRTPLNGVIGNLDLLELTTLTPKQQNYVNVANVSAQALLGIINDVLDFSKMEADKLQLLLTPTPIAPIATEVHSILQTVVHQKQLQFQLELAESLPDLLIDGDRLQQVLLNLCGNAVKFTPEQGTVKLQIKCLEQQAGQATLRFQVMDTGIGITPEQQRVVFEPFEQASSGTQRLYGGTGLGLAICVRLLRQMGTALAIESQAGQGTIFWFELTAPIVLATPQPLPPASQSLAELQRDRPLRVLVAEDNIVNQKIIRAHLKNLDCEVSLAANGRIACELYFAQPFDLILMDLEMPEMDGETATQRIRTEAARYHANPNVPIIALTAHALTEVRDRALATGMNDYVTKPIATAALVEAIVRVLAVAAAASPA